MSDSFFNHGNIQLLKNIRADFAVEVLLTERLQKFGVSPFTTYINTVVDIVDYEVETSRTLFEETLEWVESEAVPNYVQRLTDVFIRRFSFDPKDKVSGLGMVEFERIVIDLVTLLTAEPSINLAKRSISSLDLEDVRAALRKSVSDINFDEVYITSFVMERGERKIYKSRRLAEDLFESLQHDEIPYYHDDHSGVYSVAHSTEEVHLHPQLTARDITHLVIEIVPDFLI
jgi:hypothetical protein